jgi:DNA modification methylase
VQPVFEHSRGVLYCGDSLAVLRELPEASVHCCVTSPPYWGLRDYGTAQWEGGDPACDHKREMNWPDPKNPNANSANGHGAASQKLGGDCAKCGARRIDQQLGLERTPEEYISRMAEVFREVRRVLRDDGTLWLNIGDSYASQGAAHGGREDNQSGVGAKRTHAAGAGDQNARMSPAGLKPKDLVGIPWMLAFALRADGWYLRSEIIWAKPNPMPESVTDRPTKAHEQIFLLAKSQKYHYNADAIAEQADPINWRDSATRRRRPPPGMAEDSGFLKGRKYESRNKRSVWTVATEPFPEAHFATFPQALIQPCILAGCPEGGTVLDPFSGAGTTALVAKENGRRFIGVELNPGYCKIAAKRLAQEVLDLESA